MTQITAYTYESAHHCIACTHSKFAWLARFGRDEGFPLFVLDEHGVPIGVNDLDGNLIHPVFDGDELPMIDGGSLGDDAKWYEAVRYFSCGTCREQFSLLTGEMK